MPSLDKEFRKEGFRAGTCWSERDEGPNGVGTTIMDRAPTLVHKTEHFRAHDISLTCSAAPADADIEKMFDRTALDIIRRAHDRPGAPVPPPYLRTGEQFYALLRAPTSARVRGVEGSGELRPRDARESDPDALPGFARLCLGDSRVRQSAQQACEVANRRIPILMLGETGTGKESFAKAVHQFSDRRDKPFVALNCAAIPEGLIESELFGYTDGAFTGAKAKGSKGKILQANGGTLFLDEIGDMPLPLQTRLLRVLAENEVLQLGSENPISVDLHVVCATNRDLRDLVRRGLFREDLYYRWNAATFELPPLRNRTDKRNVILAILREESREQGRELTLAADVLELLTGYS